MSIEKSTAALSAYQHGNAEAKASDAYLLPAVTRIVQQHLPRGSQIFELGCGSGYVASRLTELGYQMRGVDPSVDGINQAHAAYPDLDLQIGSTYDDLASLYGSYAGVLSLEVVEHVYEPRLFARRVFELLRPGGVAIISTPYHGYLKNVALALSGKLDAHFTALWDGGHIKFWSKRTISILLREAGLEVERIHHAGRIPILAKSMIVVARRPHD